MRVWHFTEQSYHPGWASTDGPLRIKPPNKICDPRIASDLLNRYLDEYLLADELGLDIMVNEHHANMTSVTPSCSLNLSILARQTKHAKLLGLGFPIANRPDPYRIAEEISLIDVLSRGRLEVGLVKGIPYELFASNMNPVRIMSRFWEAHDLIVKALTHDQGPFRWEGEYFNYRAVNVWPRPWQQPHPPIWMPTASADSAAEIARRGYVVATFFDAGGARRVYNAYRASYRSHYSHECSEDRFAFLGMVVVADTQAEAARRAAMMKAYMPTLRRSIPGTINPPGYRPAHETVAALRKSPKGPVSYAQITMLNGEPLPPNPTDEDLAGAGALIFGTPDDVFEKIKRLYGGLGGFGHFLMMGQGGVLPHEETADSLRLFAREVLPRLRTLSLAENAAPELHAAAL